MERISGNRPLKTERLVSVALEFIYGGSFDPLHKGHVNLVKEVIRYVKELTEGESATNISNDSIAFRFLPCATPALKKASESVFVDRSEKLKEIFTDYFLEQKIEMQVDEREGLRSAEHGNKSYTIDSLKELKSENSSTLHFLIIGADNFNSLNCWKNYRELPDYCNLLVINRPKESLNDWMSLAKNYGFEVKQKSNQLLETETTGSCFYLEIAEVDISSTEIRKKIKVNQSVENWLA
ncbi:MAG: hypothetical protein COA86_06805 [Kangiella sp.]|nr:MAG: hypothetical protein COA86_06805 [Kangiella sp.]